jgi:hypothetical protein
MLVEDMKIWEKRWDSLRYQIDDLRDTLREKGAADSSLSSRQKAAVGCLRKLLECLENFAEGQVGYFKGQFSGKAPGKDESTEYPQEHVMMVTLDQIGYDLWVISHAISQRFSEVEGVNATLEKADELSYYALQPAIRAFGLGKTKIISYLHKSPSIRVIPYANTALIGIPHTAVYVPRDFLAIPHEVGHFVYWHGVTPASERTADQKELIGTHLEDKAPQKEAWANRWLEELFADLYGCYIAGPVLALSFQDLQMQQSQEDFYHDDNDHPAPVLRPNIYAKGVCKADFPNWANLLEKSWNDDKVGKRHLRSTKIAKSTKTTGAEVYEYAFKLDDGQTWVEVPKVVSLEPAKLDALLPVDCLINHIFDKAITRLKINDNNWWRKGLVDCDENAGLEALPQLFEDFDAKVNKLQLDPGVVTENEKTNINCIPHQELLDRWITAACPPDPVWLPVFKADGWTTEGPHGNPTGP